MSIHCTQNYHFSKVLIICLLLISVSTAGYTDSIRIYVDADRTGVAESGISIEQGIITALSEVDFKLAGNKVELVIRDHRGNSSRSKNNLQEFLNDKQALAVFSGLHSPPLLAHRDFINERDILLLDPWAAAGPITRYPSDENWIFRLSVDDSKAGYVIVKHALEVDEFRKPYLLLEETGWGKSNFGTMTKALEARDTKAVGTEWFNWSLGVNTARIILRKIKHSGADVIFLVANAPEGKAFARAMASLPEHERIPVRSHWGITGGDFAEKIDLETRLKFDLAFIQTKFSFLQKHQTEFSRAVFNRAKNLYPNDIKDPQDIQAPTGFIHAYDLTRILISAVNQSNLTDDMITNRNRVRVAMENLRDPVQGLIKTYKRPFSVFSEYNKDAHEALGPDDYVLARYGRSGEILLIE